LEGKSKARFAGEGEEGETTEVEGVGVVEVAAGVEVTVAELLTEWVEDRGEAGGVGVSNWW
jgi:hypothetical protein